MQIGVHAAIQIALHKNKKDKEIKKQLENMQNSQIKS
jgi:hypothetical protein